MDRIGLVGTQHRECIRDGRRIVVCDRRIRMDFDVTDPDFRLVLLPLPCLGWDHWDVRAVHGWENQFREEMTIERFGILPGTCLTLERPAR